MKRVPLLIALVLIFSFGIANSQIITAEEVDGFWFDGTNTNIKPMQPVSFDIRYENATGGSVAGMTNGFSICGSGAFTAPTATQPIDMSPYFDLVNLIGYNSADGAGCDTVTASYSVMMLTGIPDGFNEVTLNIVTGGVAEGETLCIDSAYYPPSGTWLWAPGGQPSWNGPLCYTAVQQPYIFPVISNCPGAAYTGSHCAVVSYDFDMYIDPTNEGGPFNEYFTVVSGVGSIDAGSGMWSYTPSLGDVGAALAVEVAACGDPGCGASCTYDLNFTNAAPTCDFGGTALFVGMGNPASLVLTGDDVDCDPGTFYLAGVTPTPVGLADVVGDVFTFNTAGGLTPAGDGGVTYTFTIGMTDGVDETLCDVVVDVLVEEPFEVQIEKVHYAIQGMHHMVDVTVNKGSENLKGFDILIAYDASALNFVAAVEGEVYTECGWEYFNYRYGANGNCGNGCPSGLLRVVGIAETNNGPNHPLCFSPALDFTLFTLDFLVTDDRTFECMYVPIRFYWGDCGDNSLAYSTNADPVTVVQGVSRFVFDYMDYTGEITHMGTGFPTYTGVQDFCFDNDPGKPLPVQFADFLNGGIDIICADSIDARGDINLNGFGYEIADAVLFSNYFVYGLGAFDPILLQGQIAATDTNADGLVLSVADLVYLIRVIVGDAMPYSKLSTVAATYTAEAGVVAVDQPMGAAFIVAEGNVTPTLLVDNMDMQYAFDGTNTRILVSSMQPNAMFEGAFVNVDNVISVELATYEGAPVRAKAVPRSYQLAQNYPNPFNPVTNISFALPSAGDYSLTIYNVTGQVVAEFDGTAEAGSTTLTWDANAQASGIYFYKLDVADFSETKKMVLLK